MFDFKAIVIIWLLLIRILKQKNIYNNKRDMIPKTKSRDTFEIRKMHRS